MGLSLRDQLLQTGLLTEKQAKQGSAQPRHQRADRPKKPAVPSVVDEQKLAAQRAAEEKRIRDQAANLKLLEKAEQISRRAQIKQLVDQHRRPRVNSDEFYHFVAGKKIRRIPADAALREQLGRGTLAIVNCDGNFEVVPAAIAARIAERDPKVVIPLNAAPDKAPADENDPYKDYVVPDDLIW